MPRKSMTEEEARAAAFAVAEKESKKVRSRPDRTVQAEPGDNTKFTDHTMNLMMLEPVDMSNPEEVKQRILDYFRICRDDDMKPGVADFAFALGIDRRRLWEIVTGRTVKSAEVTDMLKRTYAALNAQLENFAASGKINPVSFIFLAKNHFSYQDRQEIEVSAKSDTESSPEELDMKYRDAIPTTYTENPDEESPEK